MKVVEIFSSIDGEGCRVGLPTTFIRLFGCNLNCTFCDTTYGWQKEHESECTDMSVDDIVNKVQELGINSITVTGGEPLIHNGIDKLLRALADNGCWVNVETNGTTVPTYRHPNVFYTVDYKTNASGMTSRMNPTAFDVLTQNDVIKFVVGSIEDCVQAKQFLDRYYNKHTEDLPQIYFSPVFNKIEPADIVQFLLDNEMYNCHAQVQLHKIIWNPDKRGV